MNEQLANRTNDVIKLRIAVQLAPRRWQKALDQLRSSIENDVPWPEAVESLGRHDKDLESLLGAALAAGHPASITLNILQQRATKRISWQQLMVSLVYPLGLLVCAVVIGSLMSITMLDLAAHEWKGSYLQASGVANQTIVKRAEDFYDASIGGLMVIGWLGLLTVLAYFTATPNGWLKLVGGLPVLGKPYRWMAMSELLTRISIFVQYQPQLSKALQLAEQSFGSQALAAISRYLVHAVERGEALPNALHDTVVSDSRAGMALTLIESNDLSGSTLKASRLLDEMINATCNQLRIIVPLFIMLIVASIIWGAWSSYFELMSMFREIFYW